MRALSPLAVGLLLACAAHSFIEAFPLQSTVITVRARQVVAMLFTSSAPPCIYIAAPIRPVRMRTLPSTGMHDALSWHADTGDGTIRSWDENKLHVP